MNHQQFSFCRVGAQVGMAGRLKDMAARALLLKLEARGLIELPVRQRPSVNGQRNQRSAAPPAAPAPVQGSLASVGPLSRDWQERYGHPIHLVETFVERDRFAGTSYRAAGWVRVGATTGRGRNGGPAPQGSIKEVYVRPLRRDFRQRLEA